MKRSAVDGRRMEPSGAPLGRVAKGVMGLACLAMLVLPVVRGQVAASCAPVDEALAYWQEVERGSLHGKTLDALALELSACLGSPDPALRDGVGYGLLTSWLRGGQLSGETASVLVRNLSANLDEGLGEVGSDSVFLRSFSALILSELVRADAQSAFMSDAEREALLTATVHYISQERDLRGLEPGAGWIHGVAHASDVLWRFALHPATSAEDHRRILEGVAAAVLPEGPTFYTFNESDRLARVVVAVTARDLLPPEEMSDWLKAFARPRRLSSWNAAFADPAGMAELHNSKAFVRALHGQLSFGSAAHKELYLATLTNVLRVLTGVV